MSFYVYILQSEINNTFYKGHTDNIWRRLDEHNSGKETYSSKFKPWKLIWYTIKPTKSEAIILEKKLKNITSREKLIAFMKKHASGGQDVTPKR